MTPGPARGPAARQAGLSAASPHRAASGPPRAAGTADTMPTAQAAARPGELGEVNEAAARFFRARLPGSWAEEYLARRGFGPGIQRRWQAGYAPASWDALTRHLLALGYPRALIEAAGLARRSRRGTIIDTFRDRAILPVRAPKGNVIAFIGRAATHASGVPKYLNSPGTGLYDKSEVLFGLHEGRAALASGAHPVIAEGPLDAITTASPSRHAGVAPCGTALTARQVTALGHAADLPATGVLVAFDPDSAGRRAAVRAYHLLTPVTADVATVMLPAGCDPAQILADHGPGALAGMLVRRTRPLADLVIDTEVSKWNRWLRHPEGQVSALRAAAPLIAAMPPGHVARQVTRLASRLRLDHATVTTAVTDALPHVLAARAGQAQPHRAEPT
jgi:DNA primase